MTSILALILTIVSLHADEIVSTPEPTVVLGAEAYCAGLLATAVPANAEADADVRRALARVVGRLQRLRDEASSTSNWSRGLKRGYRELWRASGPARLSLPRGVPENIHRPRFERVVDAAYDRFREARYDQEFRDRGAVPLQRVIVGAAAIRAYFEHVHGEALSAQAEIDEAAEDRPARRPRLYPRKFLGTAVVTGALAGFGYVGWRLGLFMAHHHHPHAAVAFPAAFAIVLAGQLPPRLLRLSLSLRDTFDVLVGRANRARPRAEAKAQLRLARRIVALAEDPETPADVFMVAGWTTPLPLRHIETDRMIRSPAAGRATPTAAQIVGAMVDRGGAVLPVDRRALAQDIGFFKDERGEPTLVIVAREPKYAHDHR